jgi:hypothetical protein
MAAFLDAVAGNKRRKKTRSARALASSCGPRWRGFRQTITANPHIGFESEKVGSHPACVHPVRTSVEEPLS